MSGDRYGGPGWPEEDEAALRWWARVVLVLWLAIIGAIAALVAHVMGAWE